MRIAITTLAVLALALATEFPHARVTAQTEGDGGRYAGAMAQPSFEMEEIAPATEEASPPTPLRQLDLTGSGSRQWETGAVPDAERDAAAPAGEPLQENAAASNPLPRADGSATDAALFNRQGTAPITPSQRDRAAQPASTAKKWLAQMLAPPAGVELAGTPVSLTDAMEGVYGRQRQTEVVAAYWQLAVAVAKYYVAHQAGVTARSEADVRQAQLDAIRAQHRLARVLQWEQGRLPLPSSQPHVGSYNTRYDRIFSGRSDRRAWELHQMLPLLYELVKARAEVLTAMQSDRTAFLQAAGKFLEIAGEYNLAIAEYAQLATGDSLTGSDLVPLLIRVDRGEEEEHVAGSREGLGKTSRVNPGSTRPSRGAIVDPRVTRTSSEEPLRVRADEPSRLTQPGGALRGNAQPRVAQTPRPRQPSSSSPGTPLSDQWRERDGSQVFDQQRR